MKLRTHADGRGTFNCPGCNMIHTIKVSGAGAWTYNFNSKAPTIQPSIKVSGVVPLTDAEYERVIAGEKHVAVHYVCHSFIRDGQIEFLTDCTHSLAGQTVPLPDLEPAC